MSERTASLPVTGPPMSVRVTEHEEVAVPVTGNVPGTEYDPEEAATRDVERGLWFRALRRGYRSRSDSSDALSEASVRIRSCSRLRWGWET